MAVKETPKDYSSMYSEDFGIASLSSNASNKSSLSSLSTSTISRFLRFDSKSNSVSNKQSTTQTLQHNHNHNLNHNHNHINLKPPPIPPIPSSMVNNNSTTKNTTNMQQPPTISSPRTSLMGKQSATIPTSNTTTSLSSNTINNKTMLLNDSRTWDGSLSKRGQEPPVDLRLVVSKLEQFKKADHSADAMRTLNEHYSSVFKHGRDPKDTMQAKCNYRVCVKYHNEKDIYVIRTHHNTLKAVRNKLPIRGEFRYFFRDQDNQNVEIESDEAKLPTHYKDGQKNIYCQVFKI